MLKILSKLFYHIINYFFVILDLTIVVSTIIIFLICLNLIVCPFFIYIFFDIVVNNLDINIVCSLNDNVSSHSSYFQDLGINSSQGQTTDIPVDGVYETPRGSNNLPNSHIPVSTGVKGFYKILVNKARRKLYWEVFETDKNNYNSYNDFKKD